MGLLTSLFEPRAATFGPLEDFWYKDIGPRSASNRRVSPATALTISTVYACVRIISQTLAMVPLVVFERQSEDFKIRTPTHPLFDTVHRRPNQRQTSFQFREMMTGHALLRGNAYARIISGPRGFVDQLLPLNPDRMRCALDDDGSILYLYTPPQGSEITYFQDEILHIANISDDGVHGMSTVTLARDSFGLTKSLENHGNQFVGSGQRPAGVLSMEGSLKSGTTAHARLREDWKRFAGPSGNQEIAILEEGMKWQQLGLTNEDSQFLESRSHQVEEVASWFGVPLSLLQHTEKSTSWGTGIAMLTHGFVTFTMQPWYTRWEQEINQDLILPQDRDRFFAEFVLEGLLRGDPQTRSQFYKSAINDGWMTRNEVRRLENLNPLPGLEEPLTPLNMQRGGQPPPNGNNTLIGSLVHDTAARMARREIAAVTKAAVTYADDPFGWAGWVGDFYEKYQDDLVEVCKLNSHDAMVYAGETRDRLLEAGVGMAEFDEDSRAANLAAMMLEANDEI
jgi:HK97 family phage portal protein